MRQLRLPLRDPRGKIPPIVLARREIAETGVQPFVVLVPHPVANDRANEDEIPQRLIA